jgi:hypothetical protein
MYWIFVTRSLLLNLFFIFCNEFCSKQSLAHFNLPWLSTCIFSVHVFLVVKSFSSLVQFVFKRSFLIRAMFICSFSH